MHSDEFKGEDFRWVSSNDRAAAMQSYADALANEYPAIAGQTCYICLKDATIGGFHAIEWSGTARRYWIKIILVSIILLPLFILMHLMPISIHPHLKIRFDETIEFQTYHPICPVCWRRQRLMQGLAFLATYVLSMVLVVSFLVTPVSGALTAACLLEWFGFQLREASGNGIVFLVSSFLCVGSAIGVKRFPVFILTPPILRNLAKKPFRIAASKLVRSG